MPIATVKRFRTAPLENYTGAMDSTVSFQFGVVILGAGASRRMGRPKLLLKWGPTSVLGHLLRQWVLVGAAQVGVVCAKGAVAMEEELHRLEFPRSNLIWNPAPERGMFSSIQAAAAWNGWLTDLTHFVITLGDQPQFLQSTLTSLMNFSKDNPDFICQPGRYGRYRHPVVLPRKSFVALENSDAANLGEFLSRHETERRLFESDDAGLELDLDTPEDYLRLKPT